MVGGSASVGTAKILNGTLSSRCTPVVLPATLRMVSNAPGPGVPAGLSTVPSLPPASDRLADPGGGSGGPGTLGMLMMASAGLPTAAVKIADCSLMMVTTKRDCGSPA